jgi:hypothetical protein
MELTPEQQETLYEELRDLIDEYGLENIEVSLINLKQS